MAVAAPADAVGRRSSRKVDRDHRAPLRVLRRRRRVVARVAAGDRRGAAPHPRTHRLIDEPASPAWGHDRRRPVPGGWGPPVDGSNIRSITSGVHGGDPTSPAHPPARRAGACAPRGGGAGRPPAGAGARPLGRARRCPRRPRARRRGRAGLGAARGRRTRARDRPRSPSSWRPRSPRWGSGRRRSISTPPSASLAAAEAGVALERFAVVRRVPPARWATVVAALLDGVSLVLAEVPRGVRLGDARRLEARARERETVLVAAEPHGVAWPAGAAYVVHADRQRVGRPGTGRGLARRPSPAGAGGGPRGGAPGAAPVSSPARAEPWPARSRRRHPDLRAVVPRLAGRRRPPPRSRPGRRAGRRDRARPAGVGGALGVGRGARGGCGRRRCGAARRRRAARASWCSTPTTPPTRAPSSWWSARSRSSCRGSCSNGPASCRSRRAGRRATSGVTTRWRRGSSPGCTSSGCADVRVGIADGTFAAGLAARATEERALDVVVVPPGTSPAFLAPWPVTVLAGSVDAAHGGGGELVDLLARLGLRTLGAFAELPDAAVLGRFGPPGALARTVWRAARRSTSRWRPCHPGAARDDRARPARDARRRSRVRGEDARRPDARAARRARAVLRARDRGGGDRARRTAHALLAARGRAHAADAGRARALAARRVVDDRHRDRRSRHVLRLVPDDVGPATGRQLGFWGGDPAAADRAGRALARVQGMLGPDAVVTAVPAGGRTPVERVRWVPWGEARDEAAGRRGGFRRPWPGGAGTGTGARVRPAAARRPARRRRRTGHGVGPRRAVGRAGGVVVRGVARWWRRVGVVERAVGPRPPLVGPPAPARAVAGGRATAASPASWCSSAAAPRSRRSTTDLAGWGAESGVRGRWRRGGRGRARRRARRRSAAGTCRTRACGRVRPPPDRRSPARARVCVTSPIRTVTRGSACRLRTQSDASPAPASR